MGFPHFQEAVSNMRRDSFGIALERSERELNLSSSIYFLWLLWLFGRGSRQWIVGGVNLEPEVVLFGLVQANTSSPLRPELASRSPCQNVLDNVWRLLLCEI